MLFACECGTILRPNIVWFEDSLDQNILNNTYEIVSNCDFFISIGTSGVVFPAAGIPKLAKSNGALCIEINPENTSMSSYYDINIRKSATEGLKDFVEELSKNEK